MTVILFVLGTKGAVFVQVNTPLVGFSITFVELETSPNLGVSFVGKRVAEMVKSGVWPA